MPDRPGAKSSLLDIVLLILKALPTLPRLFANRASVVDPRIHEAGVPLPCALLPSFTGLGFTVHQED